MKAASCALFFTLMLSSAVSATEPIVLKFAVPGPARIPFNTELFPQWAEKVVAASQGTLKIEIIPGGVLGTDGQMIDRVENRIADIAFDLQGYYGARFARSDVVQLPLLFDRATPGSIAFWRVFQSGAIADDYKGLKILALTSPTPALLMTKGRVASTADIKAQKIATGGKIKSQIVSAVGAVPVTVPISDLYQSINRGVVNGALSFFTAVQPFKLQEVVTEFLDVPLGGSALMVFMSEKRFNELPEAARRAIDAASGEAFSLEFGRYWDRHDASGRDLVRKAGRTISKPSAAELERWRQATDKVTSEWTKEIPNGRAILDSFQAEIAKAQGAN